MNKAICICMALYLGLFPFVNGQTWRAIEKRAMPMKISNNAVVEAEVAGKSYVYSFGGIDSTKIFSGIANASFRYDVDLDQWDTIPALPDNRTKIAAAASYVDGIIYIIGGYSVFANGSEISSKKVHRFDPVTNTYLSDGTPLPIAIDDQVQAVYGDSLIYVVTGWSNTSNIINVQIYNVNTNSWAFGTSVPFRDYQVFGSTGTIVGDTIYYFGGATNAQFFPSSNYLRKGAINPNNPTQISWQAAILDSSTFAYRPASTSVNGNPVWIGGSSVSYNFDGIAYNGSGGVSPANRSILYEPASGKLSSAVPDTGFLPMDLRGIASISNTVKYIAGGMLDSQQVSNKTYRLEYVLVTGNLIHANPDSKAISTYPNPFRNELRVSNNHIEATRVQILSIGGRIIFESGISSGEVLSIDTKDWKNGIYILRMNSQKGSIIQKLLKSN